ncbi:MAG: 4-hydroxy-tetrahydrodipicolinate reductase [Prolixibacteraceae bacterium]|jgi:4-hydroxy-tetrahydrodipicolinate reductase|nr:4-hydroxy-tetrahydrodipicolinate reductase [Prolixibacteraceae bacterium]
MNIALIGYGRMGQEIGKIAVKRGHKIELIIDVNNSEDLTRENLKKIDVAIEFTTPTSAIQNYKACFDANVPVVSGSTGWLEKWVEVTSYCEEKNSAFFYASNFSLGVNLFFDLNKKLAKTMQQFSNYKPVMTEVHHTRKLDAPSGTAITLAEDIIEEYAQLDAWENKMVDDADKLGIVSIREGDVPGIHTVKYESEVDFIEVTHSAKSREGFALGAVIAAEFSVGKTGILSMKDLLNSKE